MSNTTVSATVRTGHGPLIVEEVELVDYQDEYSINVHFDVPGKLFQEIRITSPEKAIEFLGEYAKRRNLTIARNIPGYELALINSRHDSIRNISLSQFSGIDLLQFIEAEFITLNAVEAE